MELQPQAAVAADADDAACPSFVVQAPPLLDINREPDTLDPDSRFPVGESSSKLASHVNLNDLPDDCTVTTSTSTPPAGVPINFPCFVTHDLNISPVDTEDFAGIPTVETGLSMASIDEEDTCPLSVDGGSSENHVAPSAQSNVIPALQKSTTNIPFDDTVGLKDGPVNVAVPMVRGKSPLVGAAENVAPSLLNGGLPLLGMEQLLSGPSKESHIDEVVVEQEPQQHRNFQEIIPDAGVLKSEPSKVVALEGGQDSALGNDAVRCQDNNGSLGPGESESETPKVAEIMSLKAEELNLQAAENSLAGVLPLQGELTEMPLQDIEQFTQPNVEKQEKKAEVNQEGSGYFKGRRVLKRFGRKDFMGEVVSYEPECKWFKVVYEDGDEEELESTELEAILLPIGTLPALASRKRPPGKRPLPGGPVEEVHERDAKKMKNIKLSSPSGEEKERLKGSKKLSKSEVAAKSLQYKSKTMFKKHPQDKKHEMLSGVQADPNIRLEISKRPGKPCQKPVRKDKGGAGCTTSTKQDALGSLKGWSSTTTGQHKQKVSKMGRQKSLQKLEDVVEKGPEFKNKRRSGTGITLQEGIKRYLQKIQDTRQVHVSRVNQKADAGENKSSWGKPSKKKPKEIIGIAIEFNMKGNQIFKRCERAGEQSTAKSRYSNEVEPGVTLIGKPMRKVFSGKVYSGKVINYDRKTKFYKVRYEDGDQEDLEWSELEPTLLEENKQDNTAEGLTSKSTSDRNPVKYTRRKAASHVPESLPRLRVATRSSKRTSV